jgi:tetratricopeptide (TPR) repeat protein
MARPVSRVLSAVLTVVLGTGIGSCRTGPGDEATALRPPRLFEGLGNVHHPIRTDVPAAQRYFDQGLALSYAFNHEAAIDAFREAARLDPDCAICWWGVAFAHGPNINAPMGPQAAAEAWKAARQAERLAKHATPAERAWIDAIQTRYVEDAEASAGAQRKALDAAFADAMREVHRASPDDLHAATLFAESLMDLTPWNYWQDDGAPREHTEEVARTLAAVLDRDPNHVGALHYWIHLYERFEPERAVAEADRLWQLAPSAGHLVHMPAHIYFRVGRYTESAEVNELAAAADVAWFSWCRAPQAYASLYYTHNLHFLWASALAEGRFDASLTAARRLVAQVREEQLRDFPFLEDFLATPLLTFARFGDWDLVLGEPAPPAERRFQTALWHYARGLAYARTGDLPAAARERAALAAIAADATLGASIYDTSGGTAGERLGIAEKHLDGEIAAARGDVAAAVESLEAAIAVQDAMPYSEPPPFYVQVRQVLGGVLLDARKAAAAEAVFREDLRRFPNNGWSLYGLSKSLEAQGKRTEAHWAREGFRNAWVRAEPKRDPVLF